MDISSLMNKALSKGQALLNGAPNNIQDMASKFSSIIDKVPSPNINLDVSKIKDGILGKSQLDVDPKKMVENMMGPVSTPDTEPTIDALVKETENGVNADSYKNITTSILPSLDVPSMDEFASLGASSDIDF